MKSVGNGGLCGFTDENQKIRFIAVSASIPNSDDIADWLGRNNTKLFKFPESLRPVPLNKIVLGYHYNPKRMSAFKFDLSLNYRLRNLIIQHSEGKPTLVCRLLTVHICINIKVKTDKKKTIAYVI